MIITLKGANFSSNNIGTLDAYNVSCTLGTGAYYNGLNRVNEGSAFIGTITLGSEYELDGSIVVTMGGTTVANAVSASGGVYTITIGSVTGDISIIVNTKVKENGGEEEEEEEEEIPYVLSITKENLVVGGWSSDKGLNTTEKNRLRTVELSIKDSDIIDFDLTEGVEAYLVTRHSTDNAWTLNSDWVTGKCQIAVPGDYTYSIIMKNNLDSTPTPDEFNSSITILQTPINEEKNIYIKDFSYGSYTTLDKTKFYEQKTAEYRIMSPWISVSAGSTIRGNFGEGFRGYLAYKDSGSSSVQYTPKAWVTDLEYEVLKKGVVKLVAAIDKTVYNEDGSVNGNVIVNSTTEKITAEQISQATGSFTISIQ